MDSLYVVMPAYNEEETIRSVEQEWYPVLCGKAENSRLIIADSGSTDKTHKILLKLKQDYPQLEVLEETMKQHGETARAETACDVQICCSKQGGLCFSN